MPADPAWERRRGDDVFWFDFTAGSTTGLVGWVLPRRGDVLFWAAVVSPGRPLVLVADAHVPAPRRDQGFELRAEGLWADATCETALEHWSVGLEAFGVAFDDPLDPLRTDRGDRVALGLDLEWDASAPVAGDLHHYEQPCAVHGEVLVGEHGDVRRIEIDATGWRGHLAPLPPHGAEWGHAGAGPAATVAFPLGHLEVRAVLGARWGVGLVPSPAPG